MTNPLLVDRSPGFKRNRSLDSCLYVITLILRAYGYNGKDLSSHSQTHEHWSKLIRSCGDFRKVAKYKIAAFFSYHMNQPMPKPPFEIEDDPKFLVGGGPGRFLLKLVNSDQKLSILQSIKQSKKGMPRPDRYELKEAESEFLEKITKDKPQKDSKFLVNWADTEDYPQKVSTHLSIPAFKAEIDRTVKEIFGGNKYTMRERIKRFFPSTSANYINSRSKGGAIGYVINHKNLLKDLRRPGGFIRTDTQLIEEKISQDEESPYKTYANFEELDKQFGKLYWRILKEAISEQPYAKPVALAESLKIRVITKGPPALQTCLKNIWRFTHSILRKHRSFQLIGHPVTESIVLDIIGKNLNKDETYLSGDYEAATDNIYSWASNAVAVSLGETLGLSGTETALMIKGLTGHLFEDEKMTELTNIIKWDLPENHLHPGPSQNELIERLVNHLEQGGKDHFGFKKQRVGQLMGSIVSFPVLCIINATACRWAMELAGKRVYNLNDCPLLINGDDCVMRGGKKLYGFWKEISEFVGLKESIGKTYMSRDFLEINSTLYERLKSPKKIDYLSETKGKIKRETHLSEVKYVNVGLLLGIKRSQGVIGLNDQSDPHNNISMRSRSLLESCPEHMRTTVMEIFIQKHRELLTKSRLPWYIPEWLGGIGLPRGPWGENSELDLRLAHKILLNWAKERPIPISHQETPWQIWQIAQKGLPEPVFTTERNSDVEYYRQVVGIKCIDLLFDSNINLEDLLHEVKSNKTSKAIKHNSKLWIPKGRLPKPLTQGQIEFRPRYANWQSSKISWLSSEKPGGDLD